MISKPKSACWEVLEMAFVGGRAASVLRTATGGRAALGGPLPGAEVTEDELLALKKETGESDDVIDDEGDMDEND